MPHSASCLKKLYTNYVSYYKLLKTCSYQKTGKVQTVKIKGGWVIIFNNTKVQQAAESSSCSGMDHLQPPQTLNAVGPDARQWMNQKVMLWGELTAYTFKKYIYLRVVFNLEILTLQNVWALFLKRFSFAKITFLVINTVQPGGFSVH